LFSSFRVLEGQFLVFDAMPVSQFSFSSAHRAQAVCGCRVRFPGNIYAPCDAQTNKRHVLRHVLYAVGCDIDPMPLLYYYYYYDDNDDSSIGFINTR
jgi:hypothetical protein